MNLVTHLRLKFHYSFLQKALKEQHVQRFSKPYDRISKIGLFFDATDLDERERVLKYAQRLKKSGKKVSLLGFFDSKLENPNYTFPFFNRKNLDWALRPKKDEVDQFLKTEFDLVLFALPRSTYIAEYLGALSKARMRVGPVTDNTYAFDLMIDGGATMQLDDFFIQAESVLKLNNKQHERAKV